MSNPLNSSDEKSYQYNGYGGWSTLSLSSANSSKHQASSYDSILEKLDQKIENIAQIARDSEQRDKQIKEYYMSGGIDTLASRNSSTDSKEAETGRGIPKSAREIYPADLVGVGSNKRIDSMASPLENANKTNPKKGLLMHGKDADTHVEKLLDRVGQFNGQMKVDSTKHKDKDKPNERKIFRLEDALREQQQQQQQTQEFGSKMISAENQRRRESDYVFFSWSVYQECKEVYDKSAYVIFTRTDFEAVMESLGQKSILKQSKQQKIKGLECRLDDSDKENQENVNNRQNSKVAIQIGQTVENKQQKQQQDDQNQYFRRIQQNNNHKNGQIERLQQPLVVLNTQYNESNHPERNQPEIKKKEKTESSLQPSSSSLNMIGTRHNKSIIHLTTTAVSETQQQSNEQLYNGFKIIPKDQAAKSLVNQQPQQITNNTNSYSVIAAARSQSQQSQQCQLQESQQQTAPTTHHCSTTFQSSSSPGSSTSKNPMASEALTFNQQEQYSVGISATVTPFDQNYTCPSQSFHLAQRHTTQTSDHSNTSIQDRTNNLVTNTEETNKSLRRESSITRLVKAKIIQKDHNHHSVDAPRSPISSAVVKNQGYIDSSDNNNNTSSNSNSSNSRTTAFNEQLTILSSPSSLPLKLKPHLPSDLQSLRHHQQTNSNCQLTPSLPTMNTHKNSVSSHCSIPKPAIIARNINSQGSNVSLMQIKQQDKQEQQAQQCEGMKIIGIRKRSNYSYDRQITEAEKQQEQQQQTHFNYAKRQIQRAESTVSFNHQDSRNNNNTESNSSTQLPYTHSRQQQQMLSQNTISNPQYVTAAPNISTTTVSHQNLSMKPRCFSYDRLSTFQSSTIPNSKQPPYPSILS